MNQLMNWASQIWAGLIYELQHMSLAMALWLGLALLTIALLILMGTRWGQVKPVWKCVALSLLAHVLLGGYAYGTKLIFTAPSIPQGEPIALKVVELGESTSNPTSHEIEQVEPWDKFETVPAESVEVEEFQRIKPQVEHEVKRSTRDDQVVVEHIVQPQSSPPKTGPQISGQIQPNVLNSEKIERDPNYVPHQMVGQSVTAQEIEVARQSRIDDSSTVIPQTDDVARMNVVDNPIDRTPPANALDGSKNQGVDDLLQQLASVADQTVAPRTDATKDPFRQAKSPSEQNQQQSEDFAGPFRQASVQHRLADGQPMPEMYSNRSPGRRADAVISFGGSQKTEDAVASALKWLSINQEQDGRWSGVRFGAGQEHLVLGHDRNGAGANADTGITALSLMAFLAAGHTHLEGDYRASVQKGLEFLLRRQASNGSLAGDARLFAQMYCHAIATLAMSEALALTGDQRLAQAVQNAVNYSVRSQNRTGGGWRYQPGDQGDMSQFGWQVLALKSAELGGVDIPAETKRLMQKFLRRCSRGPAGGLAGYKPGHAPTATMTAEALLCRFLLQEQVDPKTVDEAAQLLLSQPPGTSEFNLYYWYYASLALFHAGGDSWLSWNQNLTSTLVNSQISSGQLKGSWDPNGVWCGYGGRVYSTAMATLCLEVYYRYAKAH